MKYPVALVPLLALTLNAQISNLATNADGSELQFASQYGLKGEPDPALASRIYRYVPGAPEVLARAANTADARPAAPYISDDGQTRGWFLFRPCRPSGGPCMIPRPGGGLVLTRKGETKEYFGEALRLSRNGRWLFDSGFPNFSPGTTLTDLDTGAVTRFNNLYPLHPTHAVADDGTIVTSLPGPFPGLYPGDSNTIRVSQPNTDITLPDVVRSAAIAPNGRKLFVLTSAKLYEIDRETLNRREIYTSEEPLVQFSLSAEGDRFLLQTANKALLIDTARTLHTFNGPITEVLLSPDGQTAFAIATPNRVIRIKDGEEQELYGPFTTQARQSSFGAFPGSLVRLSGGPFMENQTLTIQGRDFPVVAIGETTYEAQIPWDFDRNAGNQFTLSSPDSPFAISDRISFNADPIPAIYTDYPGSTAKAAQKDFSSLVTSENPAPAGSTIHIWLTGLGPLDRPLATGERGPVNEPARPLVPIACYILNEHNPPRGLEIPFIAYAPGLLGVYQVDLVIPTGWPAGPAALSCRLSDGYSGSAATTYIAAE